MTKELEHGREQNCCGTQKRKSAFQHKHGVEPAKEHFVFHGHGEEGECLAMHMRCRLLSGASQ